MVQAQIEVQKLENKKEHSGELGPLTRNKTSIRLSCRATNWCRSDFLTLRDFKNTEKDISFKRGRRLVWLCSSTCCKGMIWIVIFTLLSIIGRDHFNR